MVIKEIEVKEIMTKTNLPVSDFVVNPYVGCLHACKYCYDRTYWKELDEQIRDYAATRGFTYVRNDDTIRAKHGELPVVCYYFYHETLVKSAQK